MPRPNRAFAGLCIAVIVCAAFLPGIAFVEYAVFEPAWVLLAPETPVAIHLTLTRVHVQPVALLALLSSRAPPSPSLA